MHRYFFYSLLILGALFAPVTFVAAQETNSASPSPTPAPKPVQISSNKKGNRTSGVKIKPQASATPDVAAPVIIPEQKQPAENPDGDLKAPVGKSPAPAAIPDKTAEELETERLAGAAALERERAAAAAAATEKANAEFAKREADLKAQIESEKTAKENEQKANAEALEKIRVEAEKEKTRIAAEAEVEKQRIAAAAEVEKQKVAAEAEAEKNRIAADNEAAKQKAAEQAESERKQRESELKAIQERADELKRLNEKQIADAQKLADDERLKRESAEKEAADAKVKADELERKRLEDERLANEKLEAEKAEKVKLHAGLIEMTAKKLLFINTKDAFALVPDSAVSPQEIEDVLKKATAANPALNKRLSFCDGGFQGAPLNIMLSANPTLGGLLNQLSDTFDVNFLPDPEILELPVAGDVKNVPWNFVLRSQLNFLDLEARCDNGAIAILKRSKLQTIQDNQKKSAPMITDSIKLKYLQPSVPGQVNVAGRGSGGANILESLEQALTKIVRTDGDSRGAVSRIPATNEFIITASEEQWAQIRRIITKADKPSYQVVIYASIVTANENKLKDIGGQVNAIGGTANLNLLGGLNTFGGTSSTGGSSSGGSDSSTATGGLNPGGVRTLGDGFGTAPSGGSTFGVSNIFGTVQLSAQLNLLQQQGVVKIDNRPSIVVIDGQTADLQIGRQVSIPIQSIGTLGGGNGQLEVLNAGNTLNATPQVITDETGKPVAVSMSLRIESNDVDTTVVSQGVPSIIRRSTQTSLMLNTNQTAVIGGFSTDSETNSRSKTPGLGDVPIIGGLFRHTVKAKNSDRLYFAIRVQVISQGEILTTLPINIDTTPQLPNPNNDFFKPYNQPVLPGASAPISTPDKP